VGEIEGKIFQVQFGLVHHLDFGLSFNFNFGPQFVHHTIHYYDIHFGQ